MSSKIKEEEYFLWQSMIPELRKNIDQCIKEIKEKPIYINPPDDIENKIHKVKKILHEDSLFDEEEFLDVFAFFIEEKVNMTLLELTDLFSVTFGKDNTFWTSKITHWANMHTFTNSLIIWNVTEFMRNFINYASSPLERDFIYQWRQKVQAYLSSLEFLVRKIQRLKMTDSSYAIDDSYIKYHKEKMLYITFVNKFGMKNSNDDSKMSYHDEVTVTFQNKARAEKKLFNFPHATRTIDDMSNYASKHRFPTNNNNKKLSSNATNTLERYNFIKPQEEQNEDSLLERERLQRHKEEVVHNLVMVGKMSNFSLNELRDELVNAQLEHRSELERENTEFEERLREHVVKLTAKKIRQKRERKRREEEEKEKEKEEVNKEENHLEGSERMKEKSILTNEDEQFITKQTIESNQTITQLLISEMEAEEMNEPPRLYFQVLELETFESNEYIRLPMSHATFIHNSLDYYSFEGYPVGDRNIPVANPFLLYPWVNYYINDREEYEELMAISLAEVSNLEDDDSMEESELDLVDIEDEESNFIDKRAIITAENIDWDNLPAEDRMKFDQLVDENKLRWVVADSKHENFDELLSRFESVPVYGTELPYMITGKETKTTKRKVGMSKEKEGELNSQNNHENKEFEVIVERPEEEEISMTMTMINKNKVEELGNEETSFEESHRGVESGATKLNDGEKKKDIKKRESQSNSRKREKVPTISESKNEEIEI